MGTNYYAYIRTNIPGVNKVVHIGKCSCGWVFCFHFYPDWIENLQQMVDLIEHADIVDEYNHGYTFSQFMEIVNIKERHDKHDTDFCRQIDGFDWMEGDWS